MKRIRRTTPLTLHLRRNFLNDLIIERYRQGGKFDLRNLSGTGASMAEIHEAIRFLVGKKVVPPSYFRGNLPLEPEKLINPKLMVGQKPKYAHRRSKRKPWDKGIFKSKSHALANWFSKVLQKNPRKKIDLDEIVYLSGYMPDTVLNGARLLIARESNYRNSFSGKLARRLERTDVA